MFVVVNIYRGTIAEVYKVGDKNKAISYRDTITAKYEHDDEESDSFAEAYQEESGCEQMTLIDE